MTPTRRRDPIPWQCLGHAGTDNEPAVVRMVQQDSPVVANDGYPALGVRAGGIEQIAEISQGDRRRYDAEQSAIAADDATGKIDGPFAIDRVFLGNADIGAVIRDSCEMDKHVRIRFHGAGRGPRCGIVDNPPGCIQHDKRFQLRHVFAPHRQLPKHRLIRHERPKALRRVDAVFGHLVPDGLNHQIDHLQGSGGLFRENQADLRLITFVVRGCGRPRIPYCQTGAGHEQGDQHDKHRRQPVLPNGRLCCPLRFSGFRPGVSHPT